MSGKKPIFLLIDGHAVLHRAWHALPPLSTKDGRVISGAYGFTTILLKAIREFKPEYVAVTFDLEGDTFRHEEYEEYKATREKKPDELYAQIPLIERILEDMEIPVYTAEGFEADDVIGTITTLTAKQSKDVESVIVTGDLDTLQLVDDRTKVYSMRKGMTVTVLYDKKAVWERYGLTPEQLKDYKALRGDPSDNIPGVKGVGEKTATELIRTFGSIEGMYDSLGKGDKKAAEVRPSVREKLAAHKEDAEQAKGLVTIRKNVPLEFSLKDCRYVPVTREKIRDTFEEFQFTRLIQQIPEKRDKGTEGEREKGEVESNDGADPTSPPASPSVPAELRRDRPLGADAAQLFSGEESPAGGMNSTVVNNVSELKEVFGRLASGEMLAFRFVTKEKDPVTPDIIACAFGTRSEWYLVRGPMVKESAAVISEFISGYSGTLVCHDLKDELNILHSIGSEPGGRAFDLMIASYLLHSGERRHSLDALLSFYRNVPKPEKATDGESKIARLDEEITYMVSVAEELEKELKMHKLNVLNRDVELPLAAVLARMERTGILIDAKHFASFSKTLGKRIEDLTGKIYELAGGEFNINSPIQLREVLFDKLDISTKGLRKTEKSRTLSTAASELGKLKSEHEIIGLILEYRELSKLKSTYVDAIPPLTHKKTGRIHASFNQTVTATGRLSSSDPNMQNIPTADTEYGRKVRDGFVADDGYTFLATDYSQIELRIAAHIADEPAMINAFRKGEDIHWRTAVEMWGEEKAKENRRIAKIINFGILYGMGPQSLTENAGINFIEAREYIDRYFEIHRGIDRYVAGIKSRIRDVGYVETLLGRKRFFRNFDLMNRREQSEAERQAINMPIQGTSADMTKIAMVKVDRLIREKYGNDGDSPVRMLVQVHDELVFEVKDDVLDGFAKELAPTMTGVLELKVPVVVNLYSGSRWGELEPFVFV